MIRSFIYFLIIIFAQSFALAQSAWYGYLDNLALKGNINLHNEIQYRNHNLGSQLEQFIIRNGIGWNLSNDNNNILVGYAFIHNRPEAYCPIDKSMRFNENRIYQQFFTKQRFGHIFTTHRYRLEQRFLEDEFKWRFRYWLSAYIALNKPEIVAKTFFISLYNEFFIQNSSSVESLYLDRNRTFVGLGYALTNSVKLELGGLIQHIGEKRTFNAQFTLINYIALKHHR